MAQKFIRLDKTQTKCVDCGTQINNIDRPEVQYCRCRKIYTQNGKVHDNEELKPKKNQHGSLFDTSLDRTYREQ